MWQWIRELDRLLRGDATRVSALEEGTIRVPAGGLLVLVILLGMIYGACMGLFAVTGSGSGEAMQVAASMAKVPALFLLTLVVTFPSLYVFNALVGSRLNLLTMLMLLIAAMAVMLAVLASLGPIVAFFSVSTTSYYFMLLLNVVVFGTAGVLGLAFLLQTLHRLTIITGGEPPPTQPARSTPSPAPTPAPPTPPALPAEGASGQPPWPATEGSPQPPLAAAADPPGALDRLEGHVLGRHVRMIFRIWIIVFALVGAQMGWVLRPFVGHPGMPFTWLRPREGNFFEGVLNAIRQLLGA